MNATFAKTVILLLFINAAANNFVAAQTSTSSKPKHQQYRLVDLGSLGGPNSFIFGEVRSINNSGQVTSCADTADPDRSFRTAHRISTGTPSCSMRFAGPVE
jgi:hypothetical protein